MHYFQFNWVGQDILVTNLIAVSNTSHTAHHTEHVVVNGIHTHLGGVGARNGSRGKNELHHCIINAREVARPAGLVFLGAQSKGVHVDTRIGGTGVVLEGLNSVEVRTLTLGEAVLAVELQLGSDNGVLTPAVHIEGSLSKHEGASISEGGTSGSEASGSVTNDNTTNVEETRGINDTSGTRHSAIRAEGHRSVGKGINGISVVEGLGTKGLEQSGRTNEGRAVVNVGIGLNNPDELLARVVEVQLDLVGGRTDRLVTSELNLLNEVLVGVLGHLAALIGIEEDVIHVQRGSNKGLLVSGGHRQGGRSAGIQGGHGPQALTNGAEINVDLHLVVLKGNERKGKSGVAAKPELQRHVKGGLGQGVAGSAHLVGGRGGGARTRHSSEGGVGDVGKLGSVTNHLEVARLLLLGEGQLVPDVHPVTILTVNALTTNLDLNLGNQLLTNEI